MIEAAVGLVALTAVGGTGLSLWGRDRLLRRRLRATVVATLKSGAAFKGVLLEVDSRSVVLRNAEVWHSSNDGPVLVDGEVLLARSDVEYLQRP
ncbi:MAG: hypothetical protein LC798_19440 [Chloroflexi bacterium]|nr:hypothetical protein [Chloroflexota bacterium]